jgi:hypothetical protein
LGDGVVEGAGVPEADVVEDRLVGGGVNGGVGVGFELTSGSSGSMPKALRVAWM